VTHRPEIVCICGSAHFMAQMRAANRDLTFSGVIVVAPSEADESPTAEQRPSWTHSTYARSIWPIES
jgi:hypothetical protein